VSRVKKGFVRFVHWSAFFVMPDYQMQIGSGYGGGIARMRMWRGVKSAEEIAAMAKAALAKVAVLP
jgi:hypothetical protein